MNPRSVNSTNIINFGFKTTIDLELRKIIFDITGYTTFNAGGDANVTGISFEVIDPAGVLIHELQFSTPDIDPSSQSTFEVNLPSGMALFGDWKVRGVIREADGITDYEVKIPPKKVCEPSNFNGEVVEGSYSEKVDCNAPYIRLNETTALTYLNKKYTTITKSGNMYYPQGTLDPLSFSQTPAQTNNVYTGDYVVRAKSIAEYDLSDLFYVKIGYETKYKFSVTCQSRLCDIACCIEDVYNESVKYCNTARGRSAKEKLDSISVLVFTAASKERCGKDAGAIIKKIKDVLDCDCNCNESKPVEPVPVSTGGGTAITMEGGCATDVQPAEEGSLTSFIIKTKNVLVVKGDLNDGAFTIQRVEDDCNITWKITFNYSVLAQTILETIQDSTDLTELLNSLIQHPSNSIDTGDIDGRCIIDLSKCNYGLSYDVPVNGATILSIVINGNTYAAPGGTLLSDESAVQSWLNSLTLGVFFVSYTADGSGGVLSISSSNNENVISSVTLSVSGNDVIRGFTRECIGLEQILDAIIEYLCDIDATKIKLGITLSVCEIVGSSVIATPYSSNTILATFLSVFTSKFCALVTKVSEIATVSCSSIIALFPTSGAPIAATDRLLGQKSGNCANITVKELAIAILKLAQTDGEVNAEFCAVTCPTDECPAVTNLTAEQQLEIF